MILDSNNECASAEQRRAIQSKRLVYAVKKVWNAVPSYRAKMKEQGISPDDIKSIDDLNRLPFTTKDDLRAHYPFGLFAVPMSEIIRLHASSGTSGQPTVVGYTRGDLKIWGECVQRALAAFGATRDDIYHVAFGYGLFTGGMGLHNGIEMYGGTVVPSSTGNTAKQVQLLHDFGANVLCCTPSYAQYLSEAIDKYGYHNQMKLRIGVFGAEPWNLKMRTQIEQSLGIESFDIYGLSEVIGPGVAFECSEHHGLHINEDHFYPEIIDPETLQPLPDGTQGELVFTTLTKEGLPLLRYRTKDITRLIAEPCTCGRTTRRMERVTYRSDDMLIIRGVNVFPSQVESAIAEFAELSPNYLMVVDRQNNLDTLEIRIEINRGESPSNAPLQTRISRRIESILGISSKLTLLDCGELERYETKAKRVRDYRVQNV